MEEKVKTEVIRMRIDTVTKELFYNICEAKAINPSALLRQLVNEWIDEQRDEAIKQIKKIEAKKKKSA